MDSYADRLGELGAGIDEEILALEGELAKAEILNDDVDNLRATISEAHECALDIRRGLRTLDDLILILENTHAVEVAHLSVMFVDGFMAASATHQGKHAPITEDERRRMEGF